VIAISYGSASDGAAGVHWLHDAAIVGAAFLVLPGGRGASLLSMASLND